MNRVVYDFKARCTYLRSNYITLRISFGIHEFCARLGTVDPKRHMRDCEYATHERLNHEVTFTRYAARQR